jgi:hypothetical protein
VFDSRHGLGIFLFTTVSIGALGRIQPPIHWVPGDLSLGVQQTGREVDHSPPSSVEIKNVWICTSTPAVRLHGVVLRGNFTFTLQLRRDEKFAPVVYVFEIKWIRHQLLLYMQWKMYKLET